MSEKNVEVMELIETLYSMVTEAWGVPLGNDKCIVERENVLEILNEIKTRIPVELAEAKRLVSARDEFIGNAKREAESIRKNAEDKARAMLEEQEIVRVAKQHSAELVSNAEYKSKELRRVANEYVDEILRRTEETVGSALKSINQSRASFRSLAGSAAPAQPVTQDDDDDTDLTDFTPMTVEELTGGWVDDDGNQLVIVPDTSTYDYRTWYGRVGFGPFEVVDDRPVIEYDGFYYDFEADGDGFLLRQNGASDRAGLDGARFGPGESDVYAPELTTLDGIWQDALGETLVIDTDRMEYLAYSPDGMTGGTICDGGDGLGVYLFLNGRGYFAVSPDGNSFTLFFEASDTNAPDGTYEGVFYRNGDADLYAELDDAEFYASDGHLRYYDGENIFFLPDTYAVAADGLAYDGAGNVYAAGWDTPYYDPADDWGDNWASNWG